jgi:disulfide oxidoreductase YuzD
MPQGIVNMLFMGKENDRWLEAEGSTNKPDRQIVIKFLNFIRARAREFSHTRVGRRHVQKELGYPLLYVLEEAIITGGDRPSTGQQIVSRDL